MPKPIRRSYTVEEKARLMAEIERQYRAGGKTYAEIARAFGIAESSYHNWVSQGIKPAAPPPVEPNPAKPRPYTPAERERLLAEIDRLRAEGHNLDNACRAAGISDSSYRKWKDAAAPTPAMRPVEVTALVPVAPAALTIAPPKPAPAPPAEGLTLLAPGGYRIEGLGIEAAAALLRALA